MTLSIRNFKRNISYAASLYGLKYKDVEHISRFVKENILIDTPFEFIAKCYHQYPDMIRLMAKNHIKWIQQKQIVSELAKETRKLPNEVKIELQKIEKCENDRRRIGKRVVTNRRNRRKKAKAKRLKAEIAAELAPFMGKISVKKKSKFFKN